MADLNRIEKLESDVADLRVRVEALEKGLNDVRPFGRQRFRVIDDLYNKFIQVEGSIVHQRH